MANSTKTAIVTGASRGIGAGLVEAFLKRGYSVVANSRNIIKQIHSRHARMLHSSTETSATPARPLRLWILPYRDLAGSMC
jgi:NAD(P)-dependent dehydrogenase (short-subunit alcohol dehydrogenase family)